MIENLPILSAVIFLPLIGAFFIMLFLNSSDPEREAANARNTALWVSITTFLLSLILWVEFDPLIAGYQFRETVPWLPDFNMGYDIGIDAISLYLILLTTFLIPICILVSWSAIKHQVRAYMIAFLALETMVIGVFASLDFVMFYVFFEASLIPMYLIIGIWGGENRKYAAFKFFLYTLLGSVLLLLAILYVYGQFGTTSIPELTKLVPELALEIQSWLWLAFFASFAVKVPMWPFHTWLPDAHVQAPTAGSVILAGILLKLGGYGFLRFSLPMLPDASVYFADFIFVLSIIAVVYTSLVALVQKDMKKLIAYSSVAHMGIVTIGIFTFTPEGISGAYVQMISHGLVSAALFMCVGVLYDRMHTKEIARYGGLVHNMPKYSMLFMLFMLASVGLPGTSGFVGEFLVIVGAYMANPYVAAGAATGLILGAAYMLTLYRSIIFGTLKHKDLESIQDLNRREYWMFIPLVILVILLGVYPSLILQNLTMPMEQLLWAIGE